MNGHEGRMRIATGLSEVCSNDLVFRRTQHHGYLFLRHLLLLLLYLQYCSSRLRIAAFKPSSFALLTASEPPFPAVAPAGLSPSNQSAETPKEEQMF